MKPFIPLYAASVVLSSALSTPVLAQSAYATPPQLTSASRSKPASEGATMQITLKKYAKDPDSGDQLRFYLLQAPDQEAVYLHAGVLKYRYIAETATNEKQWVTVQAKDLAGNTVMQKYGFQWRNLPPAPKPMGECEADAKCWQDGHKRLFPQLTVDASYRAEDLSKPNHYLNIQLQLSDMDEMTPDTPLSISHPALNNYILAQANAYHGCLAQIVSAKTAEHGISDSHRSLPETANIVLSLTPLSQPLSGQYHQEIGPYVYVHANRPESGWSIDNYYDINLESHSSTYVPTARNSVGFVESMAEQSAPTLAGIVKREIKRSYTLLIRRAYEQYGESLDDSACQ